MDYTPKKKIVDISQKVALITGITGQDGSYLAEFLLSKGYIVHGMKRRASSLNTARIDHIYQEPFSVNQRFHLHYGDLTDDLSIINLINNIKPNEIYNLGAQSHVKVSFEQPIYTANVNALGCLRILEAIRILKFQETTRFYQASSSELYGLIREKPQTENTPFYPRSPYAVAKLHGYWSTVNYREAYGLYACNGILFNHESPRRGETFVTRKITRGIAQIIAGENSTLYLGNLDALRDWGHAKDYVELQWRMLQQESPKDYVISTGLEHSVREFVEWSLEEYGIKIVWKGEGINEIGVVLSAGCTDIKVGSVLIQVSEQYFRPSEVDQLLGDSANARRDLGWEPKCLARDLCREMTISDAKDILKSDIYDKIFHK